MPNKEAKNRKRNRLKLNAQLSRLGRTSNQVKKRRLKDAKKKEGQSIYGQERNKFISR
jgi:hypothetical protein